MLKEISIEIIRKCPNNCLHCSSSSNLKCKEVLPFDKFREVVFDAKTLGAETICLSGGEPFLHNRVVDMAKLVKGYGMDCYIYTSGITADQNGCPAALPEDILNQLYGYAAKLIFNIEAGTEQTYDKIMGTKNCFEKMQLSAIRASEAGLCTEAHFVPMKVNLDEIDAVIMLCEKIGISRLSFLRLVPHGRAKQNKELLTLSPLQNSELKNRLYKLQTESNLPVRIGVPLSLDTSCHKCEAANGKLNIKYDGKTYPCEVFKNNSMAKNLGGIEPDSIYQRSLTDIYNNSDYLRRVRELAGRYSNGLGCETCIGQHLIGIEEKEED